MITSDEIRKAVRNSDGFRSLWPDTATGGDRKAAQITLEVMALMQSKGIDIEISGSGGVIQEGDKYGR